MIIKRDRHGRVTDANVETLAEVRAVVDVSDRLVELDRIARRVFVDRNAHGAPAKERARVRAAMRPVLRKALQRAALARTALLHGDEVMFERERRNAKGLLEHAQVIFRQPYMEQRRKAHDAGARGGRPPSQHDAEWLRLFNEKKARNQALSSTAVYKHIAATWCDDEGHRRSWRTIRDGIARAKKADGKPSFSR